MRIFTQFNYCTLSIKYAQNHYKMLFLFQDILMLCWSYRSHERPDFPHLLSTLQKLPRKRLARSPSHPVHLSRSADSVFWRRRVYIRLYVHYALMLSLILCHYYLTRYALLMLYVNCLAKKKPDVASHYIIWVTLFWRNRTVAFNSAVACRHEIKVK